MERVDAVSADPHRSKLLVADRDARSRTPFAIDLQPRREVVHIRLERRLERLVPVHQVRQDRQRVRAERVQARTKDIRNTAFVHEYGHLRIAHGEFPTSLDFHVFHRVTIGERALTALGPLNDVNKLFGEKTHTNLPRQKYKLLWLTK